MESTNTNNQQNFSQVLCKVNSATYGVIAVCVCTQRTREGKKFFNDTLGFVALAAVKGEAKKQQQQQKLQNKTTTKSAGVS